MEISTQLRRLPAFFTRPRTTNGKDISSTSFTIELWSSDTGSTRPSIFLLNISFSSEPIPPRSSFALVMMKL